MFSAAESGARARRRVHISDIIDRAMLGYGCVYCGGERACAQGMRSKKEVRRDCAAPSRTSERWLSSMRPCRFRYIADPKFADGYFATAEKSA